VQFSDESLDVSQSVTTVRADDTVRKNAVYSVDYLQSCFVASYTNENARTISSSARRRKYCGLASDRRRQSGLVSGGDEG